MTALTARPADSGPEVERTPAELAHRRAWWSLLLYPVTLVVSLAIGGGLFGLLDDGAGDPAGWVYLVAVTPALLVAVIPGILAVTQGRTAMRLGRPDGRLPAILGIAIGTAVVGLDLLAFILG